MPPRVGQISLQPKLAVSRLRRIHFVDCSNVLGSLRNHPSGWHYWPPLQSLAAALEMQFLLLPWMKAWDLKPGLCSLYGGVCPINPNAMPVCSSCTIQSLSLAGELHCMSFPRGSRLNRLKEVFHD